MRGSSRVSIRYALSVLSLAKEKGVLDHVVADMAMFATTCNQNSALVSTLRSPIIKNDKKLLILKKIFEGKVNALTIAFFDIITRKSRTEYLPEIANEFAVQYKVMKGILSGEIVTAFPITDDIRQQFKSLVTNAYGKEVDLKEVVKKDIIGGFVLKVEDKQLDESVKNKLQRIKNKFKDNTYVAKY